MTTIITDIEKAAARKVLNGIFNNLLDQYLNAVEEFPELSDDLTLKTTLSDSNSRELQVSISVKGGES